MSKHFLYEKIRENLKNNKNEMFCYKISFFIMYFFFFLLFIATTSTYYYIHTTNLAFCLSSMSFVYVVDIVIFRNTSIYIVEYIM